MKGAGASSGESGSSELKTVFSIMLRGGEEKDYSRVHTDT